MYKMVGNFIGGLYIGTYYNLKPQFETIINIIKKNIPKEK